MPKRLAIIIAGAVSLGSYEAGVVYEVLKALGDHNTNAKTEDQRIYINVITGASPGDMTAAIATQRPLYDPRRLRGPEKNGFYEPSGASTGRGVPRRAMNRAANFAVQQDCRKNNWSRKLRKQCFQMLLHLFPD
jgi:hypothetical protein